MNDKPQTSKIIEKDTDYAFTLQQKLGVASNEMEEDNLTFMQSWTIEQFKEEFGAERIVVFHNSDPTKRFFVAGAQSGPVSQSGIHKYPVISKVKGEPTPQNPSGVFFLMHEAKQITNVLSFQVIREVSVRFLKRLPDELKDELYEEIQRGVRPLDSEQLLNAYMYFYGKMHNAKLRTAYDNLSAEFLKHEDIDIIDYGCGQGMGCICYADFLRENGIRQKVRRVVLIEPSKLALARAALHVSLLFPDAELRTVCKGFDDLLPDDLCSDTDTPTLHILSNILDLGDRFYDLDNFADLVAGTMEGYNEFVCVGPNFGNDNDYKIDRFLERVLFESPYFKFQRESGEFVPNKNWTCIIRCGKVYTL